ncbi:MAG: rhodanese-like domain-containing protein [Gemella sp.]|nr:rhodanese-like domain-containing protein [Gemella sp.]
MYEITVEELINVFENDNAVLIDVREKDEFAEISLEEAINIPLGQISYYEGDKSKDIYLICRTGNRSGQACKILSAKGYKAYNVLGGMEEWKKFTESI